MNFSIGHIQSNPLPGAMNWTGSGILGGDPGAQLIVEGGIPASGYVPVAEMDSSREDLLWGSYRAALKLTPVPGTCSAFFWVRFHSIHFTAPPIWSLFLIYKLVQTKLTLI